MCDGQEVVRPYAWLQSPIWVITLQSFQGLGTRSSAKRSRRSAHCEFQATRPFKTWLAPESKGPTLAGDPQQGSLWFGVGIPGSQLKGLEIWKREPLGMEPL